MIRLKSANGKFTRRAFANRFVLIGRKKLLCPRGSAGTTPSYKNEDIAYEHVFTTQGFDEA